MSRFTTLTWSVCALAGAAWLWPVGTMVYADPSPDVVQQNRAPTLPDYRLNVRDRVRVQILEWRPSRDEIYTWTALNQIYTVDPAGRISLPLAGSVNAVGYTTSELGTLISRQLAKRLNLATLPDTTVEVTDFRPVYITGAIERAGEYPYTAGMNVLQAVSLGGGLFRNNAAGGMRLEREFLTTAGSVQSLIQDRLRMVAQKARLDAELASADRIAFPAELQSVGNPQAIEFTAAIMSKEQNVFDLRRKANDTQIVALDQLKHYMGQEVETLGLRIAAQQKQIDLLRAELSGIQSLNDKGLTTQPRLLNLQRNLAEAEGEKLRIESDRARAQQEVSKAEIAKIEYQNKHDNDLTVELQTTETRLQQIAQQSAVDQQLLAETKSQVAASPLRLTSLTGQASSQADDGPKIKYTISRQIGETAIDLDATEKTILQPGDTVKVDMEMSPAAAGFDFNTGVPNAAPTTVSTTPSSPLDLDGAIRSPNRASLEPVSSTTLQP